jgi:hypothetical protein
MHWTLHPQHLQTNLEVYASNKALIFEGIHFLHVWWYLMNKDYKKLAKRVVNIHGMFNSEEDIITLMKSRAREIKKSPRVTLA